MIRNTSIRLYNLMETILKRDIPKYELGRWNSHIKKKKTWEQYADMANYDNCYRSDVKKLSKR